MKSYKRSLPECLWIRLELLDPLRCHCVDGRSVAHLSSCFSETASGPVNWEACHIIRKLSTANFLLPYAFPKSNRTYTILPVLQTADTRSSQEFSAVFNLNHKHWIVYNTVAKALKLPLRST